MISDEDHDKSNESVTEIMVNSNDEVESDNESTASIFEPDIFPQVSAKNNFREIFVFNCKITKIYHLNKDTIISCLPIFQGDLNPDEHPADNNQIPDLIDNIINTSSLTPLESEFSCIRILKDETGQELRVNNRIIYNDLKIEYLENLRLGNIIVIKYENYSVFYAIIKETFDSRPYLSDISDTLWALKHAMNELQVKTISVSRI